MRLSQSVQVLALALIGLSFVGGYFAVRQGNSASRAMAASVQHGLGVAYDRIVLMAGDQGELTDFKLSNDRFRTVLLGDSQGQHQRALPTFVASQDVSVPAPAIQLGVDELICVVRLKNRRLIGLTGKRVVRDVSETEFRTWLNENAP